MKLSRRKQLPARLGLIILAYVAFISLGLPDGLLGVAWPSIRAQFHIPLDSLGILLFASTSGYLTSSFFSGKTIARLGVGGLLALSCALTGLALLGYTFAPIWPLMVLLGVFAGLGAGAIDAGLNTYVAANFSPGLMQWLHACFGVGVTLGPIIMTAGLNNFQNWHIGYRVVGLAQVALAVIFLITRPMWHSTPAQPKPSAERLLTEYKTPLTESLRQPAVWVSLLLFFTYTGVETILGNWTYTLLTESRGFALETAGLWAGSYWAMFTVGRVLAGLYTRKISVARLVRGSSLLALGGAVILWWNPTPWSSLLGISMVGFAVAPIFPGLVSQTSERVNAQHAANTIGMQIGAAGLGAASIPALTGVLARHMSLETIPAVLTGSLLVFITLNTLAQRMNHRSQPMVQNQAR